MSSKIDDLIASSKAALQRAQDDAEHWAADGTRATQADRARIRKLARDKALTTIRSQIDSEVQSAQAARDEAQKKVAAAEYRARLASTPANYAPDGQLQRQLDGMVAPEQLIDLYNQALAAGNDSHAYQIEQHASARENLSSTGLDRLTQPVKARRVAAETEQLSAARELAQQASAEYLTSYFKAQDFQDERAQKVWQSVTA
jgi:hypothetical protein